MYIITHRKWLYLLPATLVAVSLIVSFLFGLRGGVDLTGGSLMEVSYQSGRPQVEQVEAALQPLNLGQMHVQAVGDVGYLLRMKDLNDAERQAIEQVLTIDGKPVKVERFTSIGPTIGAELRSKAWIAIGLVLFAIILYIAFAFRKVSLPVQSWKYGIITIVTLIHDIVIPIGIFAVLGQIDGAEVDSLFIVGLLTILGISINDTIVVFDRVRENLRINQDRNLKEEFESVVGRSISQTIARSINTSLTVIIVLFSLYFLGPVTTKDFALTLIVGMLAGTYSSIFLASPLLVTWERFSARKSA